MAISRIRDLPFEQVDALSLLALTQERLAPDPDYAGFGWCTVPALELDAPGQPTRRLVAPVVLALHSADEQPDADDIELLFELADQSITVPLSKFLPEALSRTPPAQDVVLALCNPAGARLTTSRASPTVHAALGDVTSWLDRNPDGSTSIRLSARRWYVVGGPP